MARTVSLEEALHPEMYRPDKGIDRHRCTRTVPLELLNLSMSRTGTASMKAAFQILGYNDVYHWFNIYDNVQDADMWNEAFAAKRTPGLRPFGRADFDKLLGHCMAVTDAPANCFADELVQAYPDAKVVLVERPIEAWYKSYQSIIEALYRPEFYAASWMDPFYMGKHYKLAVQSWTVGHYSISSQADYEAKARDIYREHNMHIREIVPKGNLLVYQLGSGWEPLCSFLGKPIPDVPFPHINEGNALKQKMDIFSQKVTARAMRNLVALASGIVAVIALGFRHYS